MLATEQPIVSHLAEIFKEREKKLNGASLSNWYAFQKESFETLSRLQFPGRQHEDWRYTTPQQLLTPQFQLSETYPSQIDFNDIPGLDTYVIEIINGQLNMDHFPSTLKEKGITISPILNAFDNEQWRNLFLRNLIIANNDAGRAFDLVNLAFQSSGYFIQIPSNTQLDKPIEIRITHFDLVESFSNPSYFVEIGKGSSITWIERFEEVSDKVSSNGGMINFAGYFHMHAGSSIHHIKWQNLPTDQKLFYKLHFSQDRDSQAKSHVFDLGGGIVRNSVEAELDASNTYTELLGSYIAAGKQSMDHQTRINHKFPHCQSREWYKGIVDDTAKAAFNGKVFVHQDAQKTNAFQQNDAIVLSPYGLMNSKPQLEIFADDVRCSHGATIGQLDEQALHYLRSRGLDETKARAILKSAFLAPLVEEIGIPELQEFIGRHMNIAEQ